MISMPLTRTISFPGQASALSTVPLLDEDELLDDELLEDELLEDELLDEDDAAELLLAPLEPPVHVHGPHPVPLALHACAP